MNKGKSWPDTLSEHELRNYPAAAGELRSKPENFLVGSGVGQALPFPVIDTGGALQV
jgi:hypothetical protein